MDDALRTLRRIGMILLLPFAALATLLLVVALATLYYLRAFGQGMYSFLLVFPSHHRHG